ncbi:MAG: glutamate racemase [Bacilli bacterium]|nr:glutamate racemase [Bacilli bacterium]MDD4388704.1 glutamate racemase [Bacilli bacterium]
MRNNPIGVFDSGIGGLTVLDKLIEIFPHEDFIYIADTKNCPYGIRSAAEIEKLVTDVVLYLLENKIKTLVIACNTATAYGTHLAEITAIPIVGVIEPTAQAAVKTTKNHKIAVLATNATIKSGFYQEYLARQLPSAFCVYPISCSEFVVAIEAGEINNDYSYRLVAEKLKPYRNENIDTAVLGCTHFGLYHREIAQMLPQANLVGSGAPTAQYLYKVLNQKELMSNNKAPGKVIVKTTGDPAKLNKQIKWFKKPYQGIYHIDI